MNCTTMWYSVRRTAAFIASLLFLSFLLTLPADAKKLPEPPDPPRLVNDFASILTAEQREALETKLVQFDNETSNQIVIVTETSLEDEPSVEVYATELFRKWGIGGKEKNNGVLIYIPIKERKVRIEVGYGLNPKITASRSGEIVSDIIEPNFAEGRFFEGLDEATDSLMSLARMEYNDPRLREPAEEEPGFPAILIAVIIIIVLLSIFRKGGRGGRGGGHAGPWWGGGPFVGGGGGGWGGGGGGWSSGGGGGGGFGGFGGGSSGGGGSTGSW